MGLSKVRCDQFGKFRPQAGGPEDVALGRIKGALGGVLHVAGLAFDEKAVHHPALAVPDIQKALDFYCGVLGFKEVMTAELPSGIPPINTAFGVPDAEGEGAGELAWGVGLVGGSPSRSTAHTTPAISAQASAAMPATQALRGIRPDPSLMSSP